MKRLCLPPFRALLLLLLLLTAAAPAHLFAEANYVYHERTTADPGCGGNYVTTLNPSSAQSYALRFKVEFQFFTDTARVYYTTNGSAPGGTFGSGNVGTFVVPATYVCTFGSPLVDVCSATIPALPAGTVVKYIVSAWHSGGGDEIFGNGCGNCGTENSSSALATVHQYTVGSTTDLYWDSNGTTAGAGATPTGTWGTSTFWSTVFDGTAATAAWTSGRNAVFSAGADASGAFTVTVTGTQTASGVKAEEGSVTLSGGTLALTGSGTYDVASGLVLLVGPTVTGTTGYGKTGAGRVSLTSGASTITGPVSVTGGILEITASGNIGGTGVGAGDITLDGGTFRNSAIGAGITFLTANRGFVIGAGGGTIDVPGTIANIQIYTSGKITGVGNTLTKSGPGVFRNITPTSITFTKLLVTGGLYQANLDNIFGAVPGSFLADAITLNGGGVSANGGFSWVANRGITIGLLGGTIDCSSAPNILGVISGPGALTKTGAQILTLSGNNTFAGGVNQSVGRINYNNNNAAGTGTITVGSGATEFVVNSGTVVLTNPIVLSSGANPKFYSTTSIEQTGEISGPGGLTRDDNGAGNVILSGPNIFSGGFSWTSRSLRLNNKQALGTGLFGIGGVAAPVTPPLTLTAVSALIGANALTNAIAINQDFTLAAVSSAQFNGPVTMAATRAITINSGVALSLAGDFSSSASVLNKYGLGTLELAGSNSFSGGVNMTNGTLRVNNIAGSGTGSGTVFVTNISTLGGTGIISGAVIIASTATLAPGNSVGTLTLGSSPVLGGILAAEINKTGVTLTGDKLVVGAALAYAGTLTVTTSGDALTGGEVFDLFDASAFSGAFTVTNLPALGAGLNWWLGTLTTDGSIAVNRAPTANTASISRPPGLSAKIKIADLMTASTSDLDGDARTFQSVGTPTNGTGTATSDATYIYYDNANALNDSFTYTIKDPRGGVTTGTISVNVSAAPSGSAQTVNTSGGGPVTVKFQGIVGYHYDIERSEDLMIWTTVATDVIANGTGAFQVVDSSPPPVSAYYRSKQH